MDGSVIPESIGFGRVPQNNLSEVERKIFSLILEYWPTSALEIAEHFSENLGSREKRKQLSTKYSYYLQKLVEKKLVFSKRFGNALIVWPVEVEKYRAIHHILSRREL